MLYIYLADSSNKLLNRGIRLPINEDELKVEVEDILEKERDKNFSNITYNDLQIEDWEWSEDIYPVIERDDIFTLNKELILLQNLSNKERKIAIYLVEDCHYTNIEKAILEVSNVEIFENTTMKDVLNDYKEQYNIFKNCPQTIKRYIEKNMSPEGFIYDYYDEIDNDVYYYER